MHTIFLKKSSSGTRNKIVNGKIGSKFVKWAVSNLPRKNIYKFLFQTSNCMNINFLRSNLKFVI